MKLPKEHHEAFAQFFEEPTRDKLRILVRGNIGETDYLDFKTDWSENSKTAKHVLALANSGGGALVIGASQTDEGVIEANGLKEFKDKADVAKGLKKYLPSSVTYNVLDFAYTEAEFPILKGKKFQVLLVEYDASSLPILALTGGASLKANCVYIREGTESIEANHEQLEKLMNLRIESGYSSSPTLELKEQLEQLKALYNCRRAKGGFVGNVALLEAIQGKSLSDYYEYIEKAIAKKQKAINQDLGI